MANEDEISERSGGGRVVEEVRQRRMAKSGGQKPGIGAMRGHGAQAVVAADDGNSGRDKSRLGEGDGEVDAPGMHGDVLPEQAGAGVLFDAEEAEEGKESGTPVSGVGKDAQVEVGPDVVQILKGEAASGLGDVVVAIPVEDAGFDPVKGAASWEFGVAPEQGVVSDGGHEASEASDAVVLGIQDADAAEV
jgi:hypothetical protein